MNQLADRLREVNDQYIFKIALQKEDDKIQKVANRLANQQRNLAQKDIEIQQKLLRLNEEYQLGLDFTNKSLQERINLTKEGLRTFQAEGGQVGLDLAALEAYRSASHRGSSGGTQGRAGTIETDTGRNSQELGG